MDSVTRLAARVDDIEPFHVMEVQTAARALEAAGRDIVHLEIGEPDFPTPQPVLDAAQRAIAGGHLHYTSALGLPELRAAIAGHYAAHYGVEVSAERVIVTAGSSAALLLVMALLVDRDDAILLADPGYPCNRHFVRVLEGTPVGVPVGPETRYQLTAELVERHWRPRTRGVLLASPSNPTGTSIDPDEMGRIVAAVRARGGFTLVDEIYLGLSFEERFGHSALMHGDDVISINSFSKYFSMTGWRLGWLVVPEALVPAIEKLAQNLYICASTLAQRAALACFEPESIAEYERRRAEFKARRDFLVPALDAIGLRVPVMPDGAFYAWADCSAHAPDSWDFVFDLMRRAQVAITPGRDFGHHHSERWVRLSYASSMAQLHEAVARLGETLSRR